MPSYMNVISEIGSKPTERSKRSWNIRMVLQQL